MLIGLQKEAISFSHPKFHKQEATLMSNRNAEREDFEEVIDCIKKGLIDRVPCSTQRVKFDGLKDIVESWLYPKRGVIKAMVELYMVQ